MKAWYKCSVSLRYMQVWYVNDENQSSCWWLFGIKGIIWIPDTLVWFWNSKMPSYHSDTRHHRHHGTGYGLFVYFLSSFWQWLKIWTPVFSILMLSLSQYQTINCLIFRWVDSKNMNKFLLETWARELSTWSREPLGPTDGGLAPEGTAAVSLKGWADSDLEENWNKTGHDRVQGMHDVVSLLIILVELVETLSKRRSL